MVDLRVGGQAAHPNLTTGADLSEAAVPGDEKRDMSKKLFVGSLSWNTDDRGLQEAFAVHGEITEAKVITDRDSGRSRGFGFVTFEDDEAADKAIAAMNETELDGRTIRVNVAQDKRRDGGGGGRGGGGYGGGGGRGGGGYGGGGGGGDRW
ncbi:MAG: RNA-binding protein [Thermoanaerobaculales bacterium]|nr:RNA-binding protein [Thermoanaerobaculales bacterium]